MKTLPLMLIGAMVAAKTHAIDVTDAQDRVTIPDGDNLTITETGSLDTSDPALLGVSAARAFDSTIQFIDNQGSILTGNDGITLFGTTVLGSITNSGSIQNLDTVVSNGIRLSGSQGGLPMLVQGNIENSGLIQIEASTCDNDVVCYGSGIAVLGISSVSNDDINLGRIINTGTIITSGGGGALDAGVLVSAQSNNDGSAPTGDQSPTVNDISNFGSINSQGTGIDIRGANLDTIFNVVGGVGAAAQPGLITASAGAGISITNTFFNGPDPTFSEFAGTTSVGQITNGAGAVIEGSDFGILISGEGTQVGLFINEGTIRSLGPGDGAAIDIMNGAVVNSINNTGSVNSVVGPAVIVENSTVERFIANSGSICPVNAMGDCRDDQSAIIVRGSLVDRIFNESGGEIVGSSAIDIEDGSNVAEITNQGGNITGANLGVSVFSGSTVDSINNNGNGVASTINGGIFIQGGSSVTSINNAANATINGGGLFGNGEAISVDGSSLVNVSNSGTINGNINFGDVAVPGQFYSTFNDGVTNGNVDFGAGGGTYIFGVGTHNGSILNADRITAQYHTVLTGIGAHSSTLVGDLQGVPNLSVLVAGVDLGNGTAITDYGQLNVQGNVNLDGTLLDIIVTAGEELITVGEELPIITATGTLATAGVNTVDNSAILDFILSEQNIGGLNSLVATVQTVGLQDFTNLVADAGVTTGDTGFSNIGSVYAVVAGDVADSLANGSVSQDSELGQVFNALVNLDANSAVNALGTLDPETAESTFQAGQAADTAAAATVNTRMSALRSSMTGLAAGDGLSMQGLWLQGYYNDTTQDLRDGVDGFEADTTGAAIGFDTVLSEEILGGAAISWANTQVDIQGAGFSELDIDSYRLTLYGSLNAENYYVDTQLAYSRNNFDNQRNIFNNLVARSSHNGSQYSVRTRAGYPLSFDNGLLVTPMAALEYSHISEDSYSEEGAGNAGLQVDVSDVEVLLMKVGAKFAYPITSESEITWIPELTLDVSHDFIGDEVILDSNFLGVSAASFLTQGANVEKTGYNVGLRLRALGQGNFSVSAGYDFLYKEDYESQSFNATLRYDF